MPINGKTPTPPTQRELSLSQHTPSYPAEGNPNLSAELNNRALQTSFADDDTKPFSVGIQDIDEAIFYAHSRATGNKNDEIYGRGSRSRMYELYF